MPRLLSHIPTSPSGHWVLFFLIFILCFERISFQMQCPRYPISHYSGSNSLNAEKQSSYLVFTTVKPSDATEGEVEEWRMLQLFRTAPVPVTIRDQHSRSPLDHTYLPALLPPLSLFPILPLKTTPYFLPPHEVFPWVTACNTSIKLFSSNT